jgi:hypothetical protein
VNVDNRRFDAKRPGGIFKRTDKNSSNGVIRIIDHRDVCKVRYNLFERLQLFADDRSLHEREAGDIAAGMGNALNVAASDRFSAAGIDDRNRARQFHQNRNDAAANSKDYVGFQLHEVFCCGMY